MPFSPPLFVFLLKAFKMFCRIGAWTSSVTKTGHSAFQFFLVENVIWETVTYFFFLEQGIHLDTNTCRLCKQKLFILRLLVDYKMLIDPSFKEISA